MKRILCAVLTAALALALCASAGAEAYTHPTAGFHLTIPEGWLAVDSVNAEEIVNSGWVSEDLAAMITHLRNALDSSHIVYLYQEEAAEPPFVNMQVELLVELDDDITLDDLLAIVQEQEAYCLEDPEHYPGYTVTVPADAEPVDGWLSMGYLGGVYDMPVYHYRVTISQIFVAIGPQCYSFLLTGEESQTPDAIDDFDDLLGSFVAP